jgi:hypothetical protein
LAKKCVSDLGFYSTPESHFLHEILREIFFSKSRKLSYERYSKILNNSFKFKVWNVEIPYFEYISFDNVTDFYLSLVAEYNGTNIEDIRAGVVIDHTPENTLNLNLILNHIKTSRVLYLIRDPRSLFNSIKDLNWGPNTSVSFCKHYIKYLGLIDENVNKDKDPLIAYFEDFLTDESFFYGKIREVVGNYHINQSKIFNLPDYTKKQHLLVNSSAANKNRADAWQKELNTFDVCYINSVVLKNKYKILNNYHSKCTDYSKVRYFTSFFVEYYFKVRNKIERYQMERKILRSEDV